MTEDEKYGVILKELGEIIQQKNQYIEIRDFEVSRLKNLLSDAEDKIALLRKEE